MYTLWTNINIHNYWYIDSNLLKLNFIIYFFTLENENWTIIVIVFLNMHCGHRNHYLLKDWQTCYVVHDLFFISFPLLWCTRHSASCVLLIIQLKQYKYTRHLGPSLINLDFHTVGLCWVSLNFINETNLHSASVHVLCSEALLILMFFFFFFFFKIFLIFFLLFLVKFI